MWNSSTQDTERVTGLDGSRTGLGKDVIEEESPVKQLHAKITKWNFQLQGKSISERRMLGPNNANSPLFQSIVLILLFWGQCGAETVLKRQRREGWQKSYAQRKLGGRFLSFGSASIRLEGSPEPG